MNRLKKYEMKKRIRDNRGFSLVELIVVIAILSVIAGVSVSMLGVVPKARVNSCAKKLVSQLEKTRTNSLSFKDASLYLYRDTDGIYADLVIDKGGTSPVTLTERIGDKELTVKYTLADGTGGGTTYELGNVSDGGAKLILSFNRSSGAFKYPSIMDGTGLGPTEQTVYCNKITISYGSRVREIKLIPLTGKIEE